MSIPSITITDDLPEEYGGYFSWPWFIKIRPKYQEDIGLLNHEKEHWKQCYRSLFIIHPILYQFYKPYRLWAEVKAYRKQMEYPGTLDKSVLADCFGGYIATEYNLDITKEDAIKLLLADTY